MSALVRVLDTILDFSRVDGNVTRLESRVLGLAKKEITEMRKLLRDACSTTLKGFYFGYGSTSDDVTYNEAKVRIEASLLSVTVIMMLAIYTGHHRCASGCVMNICVSVLRCLSIGAAIQKVCADLLLQLDDAEYAFKISSAPVVTLLGIEKAGVHIYHEGILLSYLTQPEKLEAGLKDVVRDYGEATSTFGRPLTLHVLDGLVRNNVAAAVILDVGTRSRNLFGQFIQVNCACT
jgi:hypothetical protein